MRPLLVGEDNPYGADPYFALFPEPQRSAGWRLAVEILGLSRARYLRTFDRVNLCSGRWSARDARVKALGILEDSSRDDIILLGRKVAEAFEVALGLVAGELRPFTTARHAYRDIICLPHPSGRCRVWNEAGAVERARALMARYLVSEERSGEDERA